METTTPVTKQKIPLGVLTELIARMSLASKLGTQQYGGDRDIYQALGYKETITFADYYGRYTRQDIAKAVIDRPISVTWRGKLTIAEGEADTETALEREWKKLDQTLGLKSKFSRVDKLTGLGSYGVLLLGLNDVTNVDGFAKPTSPGRKLLYVKPLSSESAKINTYESDPMNARYGLPLMYQITVQDAAVGSTKDLLVHYSRVIHITDDLLENEVLSLPRLMPVFNRLMDLEKLVGGDAEMFWRGARPGYAGSLEKDYQMTDTTMSDLQDQIDEYEHNLRRILVNEGVKLESLAQQIADPKNHVDIQIQMISAVTGIPKRILTGSERGELSSEQDTGEWLAYVQGRREEYAEPRIIRPFIDRCMELKILPQSKSGYTVIWDDLFSISKKDKAEINRINAEALKAYFSQPLTPELFPFEAFLEYVMGMSPEQIERINTMREEQAEMSVEEPEEDEPVEPETPPANPEEIEEPEETE